MHAAKNIASTISDPLTWDEICERYPEEWVCLVEIDRIEPNNFEFRTARVVGHGKKRLEPLRMARPWWQHHPRIGHCHTGTSSVTRGTVRGADMTEDDHRRLEQALAPCSDTAARTAPTISEPLTWEEICKRYPDEWVCLVEIDRIEPNNFEFRTARVVGHGKTRRDPSEQALPWWEYYDEIGHYSTTPIPDVTDAFPRCFERIDVPMGPPRFYARYDLSDETITPVTKGCEP